MPRDPQTPTLRNDEWFETAQLPDGSRIGLTSGAARVARVHRSGRTSVVSVPNVEGNLGGAEVVVSPSGRVAVLSCFSGQSEQAYEAFDLRDGRLERSQRSSSQVESQ